METILPQLTGRTAVEDFRVRSLFPDKGNSEQYSHLCEYLEICYHF
jgi:hypothetical protein